MMTRLTLATPLALAASACAIIPEPSAGGVCDAEGVQKYVGAKLTPDLTETIRAESGAEISRTGGPNDVWTMDYREDRVSIGYDNAMVIIRIVCG